MKALYIKQMERTMLAVAALLLVHATLYAQDEEPATAEGKLRIEFVEEDSVRQVKAIVTAVNQAGVESPAPEVDVAVYIKKSFGLFPLGDPQTTDENGEVTFDFPADIPGDNKGNVTVVAKVDENEVLGSFETEKPVQWAVPASANHSLNQRALWATGRNAPVPLVIIVTSMVAGVWAVILYIIYQLFNIKKAGKNEITSQI